MICSIEDSISFNAESNSWAARQRSLVAALLASYAVKERPRTELSRRGRRRSGRTAYSGFILLLLLMACAPNAPQDTLRPAGPIAERINSLFWPVFWIGVAIFVLVEGALLWAILRYRDRGQTTGPQQTHGNTRLEIAWTAAPTLLLAFFVAIPTVATIASLSRKPTGDIVDVKVTAHQWWWEYEYPELGVLTANELHIPLDKPVFIALESDDVIHSFWVPRLAGKQDVVPGRTNHMTIEAAEPGVYPGQCTEYCGLSHANMRLVVVAESQEDFDAWVAGQKLAARSPADPLARQGENIFLTGSWPNGTCAACHTVAGTTAQGKVGPDLTHLAARSVFAGAMFERTPENLARWLGNPPGVKAGSRMPRLGLSREEIEALVAYLESLR